MASADASPPRKKLVWMDDKERMQTPPLSPEARLEAGTLLRLVQEGVSLSPPQGRPMPSVGKRCHEIRVTDQNRIWRLIYRIDSNAIVIAAVFFKTTRATSQQDINTSKSRLVAYDQAVADVERMRRSKQ
jgi:phage-related protein